MMVVFFPICIPKYGYIYLQIFHYHLDSDRCHSATSMSPAYLSSKHCLKYSIHLGFFFRREVRNRVVGEKQLEGSAHFRHAYSIMPACSDQDYPNYIGSHSYTLALEIHRQRCCRLLLQAPVVTVIDTPRVFSSMYFHTRVNGLVVIYLWLSYMGHIDMPFMAYAHIWNNSLYIAQAQTLFW